MNNFTKSKFKTYFSSWLLGIFILILSIVAVGTELFQLAPKGQKELSVYSNPIQADVISNLKTMKIINKLGTFTITEDKSGWLLKEPRQMPLKSATKNNIFESLKNITVKNIHQYEPINLSSFSLDRPVLTLQLITKLDEQLEVKIGLINPINNTTYVTVSNQNQIFQTDILKNNLEALDLGDFIDSKVFSIDPSEVISFKIFRGLTSQTISHLTKENASWKSQKYNVISDENTFNTISEILSIKAQYIVDGQDEETLNTINNYLSNPLYRLEIESNNQKTQYQISTLVKSIPGLKLEKRQFFIIKASDREFPYIVAKDLLNLFQIRYQNLR